jgi:Tfp pilus assembly protein PilE
MKLIALAFAALFLAVLGLSVPAPMFTSAAFANRMNGKATCGQMNCMQDRYYAAQRKAAKATKTK